MAATMAPWLENLLLQAVDAGFALRREPRPSAERVAACKLISHRGERDDCKVFENTYAAFDPLRGSGVFGIEFDVRWTRDLVPVVFHDLDLLRLFGDHTCIADLTWDELRRRRPEVPDLHGFVRRYVDEFHLMAELKTQHHPDPARQNQALAEALAPALERRRCHLISLQPEQLGLFPAVPAAQTLGVARLNLKQISDEALARGRGGVASHYAFLQAADIERHHKAGQKVGCGFPQSQTVLFREINRGVDWIFSNEALRLQRGLAVQRGS